MLHDYLVMTSWSVEQHNYRAFLIYGQLIYKHGKLV